jgi:DNA-binding FrmR family transcriptional regulator
VPVTLAITGMTCGHCVATVRDALATVPTVVVHDVAVGRATIDAADTEALDAATAALAAIGYPATVVADAAEARRAVGVDADIKARNITRLRRIEGQVRGLQKMVEDDRYCADIMTQISSVQEALRAVGRELMRNHLKHCASRALRGTPDEAEAMYDELVELMYKHAR